MLKKFTLIITFGFLIFTFGLSVGAQSKTSKAKKLITKTSAKTTEKNEVSPVREPPKISTKKNERPQVQNREMTDNNHLEAIEKKVKW
ncbi:MAG: hypothetical protein WKF71_19785 [Pyrinomonadaceae bacterium]